jgi:hypothetical protein
MKSDQSKKMDSRMMEMCSSMSKEECQAMMKTMMPMMMQQMDTKQKDNMLEMMLTNMLSGSGNNEKLTVYQKLMSHAVNNVPVDELISYTKQLLNNDENLKKVASKIMN